MDIYVKANMVLSKFARDYMDLKKSLPVRPSEMGVLNIITRRDGLFTPLMLKELLGVSKPMITAHLNVLEKKGYIYKDYALTDKRSFYVMPTDKAKTLVEKTEKETNEILKGIENGLGREQFGLLIELLDKSQKFLEKQG